MTRAFKRHEIRRLPVLFMMDTSTAMAGTLQVVMQDGPGVVKRELALYPRVSRYVYMGEITFSEDARLYKLVHCTSFVGANLRVNGSCMLSPALALLKEVLAFDLILPSAFQAGDYAPLIFLILGNFPVDEWHESFASLVTFTGNQRPLIVTLVTQVELVLKMKRYSNHLLLLNSADASGMTNFFFWVVQMILQTYEQYSQGVNEIDLPKLPHGLVVPQYKERK